MTSAFCGSRLLHAHSRGIPSHLHPNRSPPHPPTHPPTLSLCGVSGLGPSALPLCSRRRPTSLLPPATSVLEHHCSHRPPSPSPLRVEQGRPSSRRNGEEQGWSGTRPTPGGARARWSSVGGPLPPRAFRWHEAGGNLVQGAQAASAAGLLLLPSRRQPRSGGGRSRVLRAGRRLEHGTAAGARRVRPLPAMAAAHPPSPPCASTYSRRSAPARTSSSSGP
jgi:hypothetical protein